jgi:hypothetical protein
MIHLESFYFMPYLLLVTLFFKMDKIWKLINVLMTVIMVIMWHQIDPFSALLLLDSIVIVRVLILFIKTGQGGVIDWEFYTLLLVGFTLTGIIAGTILALSLLFLSGLVLSLVIYQVGKGETK